MVYTAVMSTKSPLPVDKRVGAKIKARRVELGMSQEKLADHLGLTFQQVQKYEKGMNRVGASRLQQIAEALKVSIPYFFEDAARGAKAEARIDRDSAMFDQFLDSTDGMALARAFWAIESRALKRAVLTMVEEIAAAKS